MRVTLSLTCLFLAVAQDALGALQCYTSDGRENTDPSVVACDSSATGQTGSHSACCNKGTGDACLSTGLCMSTAAKTPNSLIWINGCTDSTWGDASCPQYCNPAPNATSDAVSNKLHVCGGGLFCCSGAYADDVECCRHNFTLTRNIGTVTAQLSKNGTATANGVAAAPSSSGGPSTTAIAGGVLGTLLLAVTIALVVVVLQNRRLKGAVAEKAGLLASHSQQPSPAYPGVDYKLQPVQSVQYFHRSQSQEAATVNYQPSELPASDHRGQLP